MKSSTNRALVAKKQSTFSAVMANSIQKVLQGYTRGIRITAVLTLLLAMGIGSAWAGAGFWDNGGIVLTFTVNTSTATRTLNNASQGGATPLGDITSAIVLKSAKANVWRDNGSGNICSVSMYYRVKNASGTVVLDKSGTATSLSYNSSNDKNQVWQNTGINVDLMNGGLAPGTYTFECWFNATGSSSSSTDCNTTFWYSNSNNNYKYTFTIPSKNLTVDGAANGNTVSGSVTGITKGKAYTIKATPAEGYSFKQWNITGGSSSITLASNTNATTTVTFNNYANNATVTATFTLNTYTVTWSVNGEVLAAAELGGASTSVSHGSKIAVAPSVDVLEYCGDKFVGWTTAPYAHATTEPDPLYATAAEIPAITGDQTFYAVFADYED